MLWSEVLRTTPGEKCFDHMHVKSCLVRSSFDVRCERPGSWISGSWILIKTQLLADSSSYSIILLCWTHYYLPVCSAAFFPSNYITASKSQNMARCMIPYTDDEELWFNSVNDGYSQEDDKMRSLWRTLRTFARQDGMYFLQ